MLDGLNDAFCKTHPWLEQKDCTRSAHAAVSEVSAGTLLNKALSMRRKRAGEHLPTTTPTPPNTYHYPYSSPYLPPWAPPAFLEGWGQDRVRGRHVIAKNYYEGVVHFWPIQPGEKGQGGGGGMRMFLVILNTLMFY